MKQKYGAFEDESAMQENEKKKKKKKSKTKNNIK